MKKITAITFLSASLITTCASASWYEKFKESLATTIEALLPQKAKEELKKRSYTS